MNNVAGINLNKTNYERNMNDCHAFSGSGYSTPKVSTVIVAIF